MHLIFPPKICIGIVLDYSWDMFMSQEKFQTMSMQNFWWVKEVHYGIVQVVNDSYRIVPIYKQTNRYNEIYILLKQVTCTWICPS